MSDNYQKIVHANLDRLYGSRPADLAGMLPARADGERFGFQAFGQRCVLAPDGITLDGGQPASVVAILVTLYALHAASEVLVSEPFRAFREFPDTAPYAGAFAAHTERPLVASVDAVRRARAAIVRKLDGRDAPGGAGGDFAFVVRPLPKIELCYIFYAADEEFPASATCLYSANAHRFLPVDGLADVGEYTSKRILELIR